jgi:hypothetical protein
LTEPLPLRHSPKQRNDIQLPIRQNHIAAGIELQKKPVMAVAESDVDYPVGSYL